MSIFRAWCHHLSIWSVWSHTIYWMQRALADQGWFTLFDRIHCLPLMNWRGNYKSVWVTNSEVCLKWKPSFEGTRSSSYLGIFSNPLSQDSTQMYLHGMSIYCHAWILNVFTKKMHPHHPMHLLPSLLEFNAEIQTAYPQNHWQACYQLSYRTSLKSQYLWQCDFNYNFFKKCN
jgi:hypothetical protein